MSNTINQPRTFGQYVYYIEGEAIKEEDMAEAQWQRELATYLVSVLRHLYRYEKWYIGNDINVYLAGNYGERTAPDILLVKGLVLDKKQRIALKSYAIKPPERPAPNVVFEIMSEATWDTDVNPDLKAAHYGHFGVKEYFAFDPVDEWPKSSRRLIGWHYPDGNTPVEIEADLQTGQLWSNELDSWLVVEDNYVRLYDRDGNVRLSEVEAKEEALQAVQAQYNAELDAKEAALQAAEAEVEAEQTARQEAERKLAEVYAKVRELKLDPDKL